MNKLFLLLTALLLINSVLAYDIAYVVKDINNPDSSFINAISELGYTYQLIGESEVLTTDFSQYRMILIGDERIKNVPVNNYKSLILNPDYYSSFAISKGSISKSVPMSAYVIDTNSDISKNIPQNFQVYTQGNTNTIMYYLTGRKYDTSPVVLVGSSFSDSGKFVISTKNLPRRVFFGITKTNYWTTNSKELFKNSIKWIFNGDDFDGDGVYGDLDCNDKDPDVFQLLSGYNDNDNDGFTIGNIINVCSGTSLPQGYIATKSTTDDCNDTNQNIFQTLIGYQDFDKDSFATGNLLNICSGNTLPEGYVQTKAQSNDCNDLDPLKWQTLQGYVDNDNDGISIGNIINVCSGNSLPIDYIETKSTNDDCNETNPDLYQLLNGYIDNDKDSFGTGNSLNVCSGENLPEGYSLLNIDCNDNDPSSWQLLEGYLDNDKDLVGTGNIINVCSGIDLPEGTSTFNGDCNDNDSSFWQSLEGYDDLDLDGYGIGNIKLLCSGNDLEINYSVISGDCNDNNFNINPDAKEIPYDNVDQNCDSYDSGDYDDDGYCKYGFNIINISAQCNKETSNFGTDCNDRNPDISPGVEDQTQNCYNDGPNIEPIEQITVEESEDVVIVVMANDPEIDPVSYSINESRFLKVNNVFTWHTTLDDSGKYYIKVFASDGDKTSETVVKVNVMDKNRLPDCSLIPDFTWEEDNSITIDLTDYCTDPDNDQLIYDVSDTTDNPNLEVNFNGSIVSFTPKTNWFGSDFIQFSVNDGTDTITTNNFRLRTNSVNDRPRFLGNIGKIIIEEDSSALARLDLKDYFFDPENDDMMYNVTNDDDNILFMINNGVVDILPIANYNGQINVTFTASDQDYATESNNVIIEVTDVNEQPLFKDLNCNTSISEESEHECNIESNDSENDIVSYSVVSTNNLNCSFSGNTLKYKPYKDFTGVASCIIRVSDSYSKNDKEFRVDVNNVNDPPVIDSVVPENNAKVLVNTYNIFKINAHDIDSNLIYRWYNDENNNLGNTNNYNFKNNVTGTFSLRVVAEDGEYNVTNLWTIVVGDINEFTCSEVAGHICNSDQICKGEILGVSDSTNCCSIACSIKPPEFNAIKKRCINSTSDIVIEFRNSTETYVAGENGIKKIYITNHLNEEHEFNLDLYLYDISKDKIIEKYSQKSSIAEDNSKLMTFDLLIPYEIKDTNDFMLFLRVNDNDDSDNDYCNEDYQEVKIDRKSSDVIIDSIESSEQNLLCGDLFNLEVGLKNMGSDDQKVNLEISNSKLKINENVNDIKLESFDGDDSTLKKFSFIVPEDIVDGNYKIKVIGKYNDKTITKDIEINVSECKKIETEVKPIETISLDKIDNSQTVKEKSKFPLLASLIGSMILIGLLILTVFLLMIKKEEETNILEYAKVSENNIKIKRSNNKLQRYNRKK